MNHKVHHKGLQKLQSLIISLFILFFPGCEKRDQDGSLNKQVSVPQSDDGKFPGRVGDQEKARLRSPFQRWAQFQGA